MFGLRLVWVEWEWCRWHLHWHHHQEFLGKLQSCWELQYPAGGCYDLHDGDGITMIRFTWKVTLQSMSSKGILGLSGLNSSGKTKAMYLDSKLYHNIKHTIHMYVRHLSQEYWASVMLVKRWCWTTVEPFLGGRGVSSVSSTVYIFNSTFLHQTQFKREHGCI